MLSCSHVLSIGLWCNGSSAIMALQPVGHSISPPFVILLLHCLLCVPLSSLDFLTDFYNCALENISTPFSLSLLSPCSDGWIPLTGCMLWKVKSDRPANQFHLKVGSRQGAQDGCATPRRFSSKTISLTLDDYFGRSLLSSELPFPFHMALSLTGWYSFLCFGQTKSVEEVYH